MIKKIKKIKDKSFESFKKYISKIYEIIMEPEMGILPGQVAFSMLLSIVPIITLLGYAASLFGINMEYIIDTLDGVIPSGASFFVPYLKGRSIDLGLTLVFIWMFYLASNGCNSVILISNQIYGINQSNWIKRRIKAIFMTISIVLIILFLLIIQVFGAKLLNVLSFVSFYDKLKIVFRYLRTPIIWVVLFVFLKAFYEFSPDRVRKRTHIYTGTIFTTIGWFVVTAVYTALAKNITRYNLFYGALTNVAFLMIWLYFIAFVFVIGLSLNYGSEKEKNTLDKTGAIKIIKNK